MPFKNKERWFKEIKANPEVFVLSFLLIIAIVTQKVGALGYCQIWGITVAIGALWVILFPNYLQDSSSSTVAVKFIEILTVGMCIISVDLIEGMIGSLIMDINNGEKTGVITIWILFIGVLLMIFGLLGSILCKKLDLIIRKVSKLKLRLYASVVFATAIFLIVKVNIANTKLISFGHIGE